MSERIDSRGVNTRHRAATAKGRVSSRTKQAAMKGGLTEAGRATGGEARIVPPVVFFVAGEAKTKGSFVPIPTASGGVVVKRSSKGGAGWERAVRRAAWEAYRGVGLDVSADRPAIGKGTPVRVVALFVLPRPGYHYAKSGDLLVRFLAASPVVLRDGDKLLRAVFDGLTGAAYVDDGQVTEWQGAKVYVRPNEAPGAWVSVKVAGTQEAVWEE